MAEALRALPCLWVEVGDKRVAASAPELEIQVRFLLEKKVVVLAVGATQYILKLHNLHSVAVCVAEARWRVRWWNGHDLQVKTITAEGLRDGGVDLTEDRILKQRYFDFAPRIIGGTDQATREHEERLLPPFYSHPVWRNVIHLVDAAGGDASPAISWTTSRFSMAGLRLWLERPEDARQARQVLAALPGLEVLRLSDSSWSHAALHELLLGLGAHKAAYLRELELRNVLYGRGALERLKTVADLAHFAHASPSLRRIVLADNNLGSGAGPASTFAAAETGAKQGGPATAGNGAGHEVLRAALPLAFGKGVEDLDLSNCELGDDGGAVLGHYLASDACASDCLARLRLQRNFLSDACAKVLGEGLSRFHYSLRELSLAHNHLTSAGLLLLLDQGLRSCAGLEVLDLSDNPLGTTSAAQVLVGGCARWPQLRVLRLNRCVMNMGNLLGGLQAAFPKAKPAALAELELRGNGLDAANLAQILDLRGSAASNLRRLDVTGAVEAPEAMAKLRGAIAEVICDWSHKHSN